MELVERIANISPNSHIWIYFTDTVRDSRHAFHKYIVHGHVDYLLVDEKKRRILHFTINKLCLFNACQLLIDADIMEGILPKYLLGSAGLITFTETFFASIQSGRKVHCLHPPALAFAAGRAKLSNWKHIWIIMECQPIATYMHIGANEEWVNSFLALALKWCEENTDRMVCARGFLFKNIDEGRGIVKFANASW